MSDLVQAVKAAICVALEGDCQRNEDGSIVILVEPAARAAIRATLEALVAETCTDIDPVLVRDFAARHDIALDG